MIKYIGSKRVLVPDLVAILSAFPEHTSALDLFSGTSRVGHAMKGAGLRVLANDHNAYAHTLARCYVEADRERHGPEAERLLAELRTTPPKAGYFTQTYCIDSRFIQPKNGERIDAIREAIHKKSLDPILESVLLTSLMEAADRVDSTCGLQMAYVKQWSSRSHNELELRLPELLPASPHGRSRAYRMDANEAAAELSREVDVTYIDPPYNQHSYLSNYHIWETLVLWDHPETYGKARKRIDCKSRKSNYNSKRKILQSFSDLIEKIQSKLIIISFNNEGYLDRETIEAVLRRRGPVLTLSRDFKRYVGAQIGIYNPSGEKVGRVSHLRNRELIYLVATEGFKRSSELRERLARCSLEILDAPDAAEEMGERLGGEPPRAIEIEE